MDTLYRLIYTSTMATNVDATCLPQLLQIATRNNSRLGVTSLLIFDGLRFCHYLEGTNDGLSSLLQHILADARHMEVNVREQIKLDGDRFFPQWPIAFAMTQPEALDEFDKLAGQSAFAILDALRMTLDLEHMRTG